MHALRTLKLVLAATACLLLASPALAVPIVFQLQSGVEHGFGFSSLHDADDSRPMSGSNIGSLSGNLTLDYDGADTYSFVASIVFAGGPPVCCGANGPNRVSPSELRLWGASDIPASGGVQGPSKRIGMDPEARTPCRERTRPCSSRSERS